MSRSVSIAGLYAIADTRYLDDAALAGAVGRAILGGARLIQYRSKTEDRTTRLRHASSLSAICRRHNVPLIINDDVELALTVGADGVHLGRDDPDPRVARARLGADAVVGVSCYNELERARAAEAQGADYVAFGSFFPSRTKPGAARAGIELLQAARREISLPLVAIGGITPENGGALIEAGASALAVIEGVFNQPDVRAAAARYARLFV